MMQRLARAFFAAHPELSLAALGARDHADALDLAPFGCPVRYLAAEQNAALIERYRAASRLAYPGALMLPGWVLADLILLPGAMGMLLGPARALPEETRARLELHPDDEALVATHFAAPSVTPGLVIGASLWSHLPGIGASAWVKALTLKMLRAERIRGVTQWDNPSVRVHTRLGPLRLVSAVPGGHEFGARSFVYELDVRDEARVAEAMQRRLALAPTRQVAIEDSAALAALLARAERGEVVHIVPPGRGAGGTLLIREAGDPDPVLTKR